MWNAAVGPVSEHIILIGMETSAVPFHGHTPVNPGSQQDQSKYEASLAYTM